MPLSLNALAAAAALAACTGQPVAIEKIARKHPDLPRLLQAKRESDRKNYRVKHSIMRGLITKHPKDFKVDSYKNGVVGVTHRATGFRLHLPKHAVPTALLGRK